MNKQDWTYKKLGDIATLYDSQRKPVTKKDRVSGMYPYYGATGIQDYVDGYIFDGRYLLLGEDGAKWGANEKSAFIIEGKSWVNNHAHIMRFDERVNDSFVEYYLNGKDLNEFITGAVVPKLTQAKLAQIPIPVPPVDEQERIVAELDLLSSILEKKKAQLQEYDQLAQSIFYDMFGDPITNEKGWEVKKLGDMALVRTGPFGSLLHKKDYISNGIPLVNPVHMRDFQVVADMEFTISDKKAEELSNYILQENDILFARRGDIGRCAVVSKKENGYLCGTGSLFARFSVTVSPEYIMYIIRSKSFTDELISKAKGATMLNLNSNIISSLSIPLPPVSLQQQFAERIEAIEKQKALVQASIAETETLFNSRMDYYFN